MLPAPVPQALRSLVLPLAASVALGCGGRSGDVVPAAAPEEAVRAFMGAVKASDLTVMSRLWGTAKGPAAGRMKSEELQQRLTVMKTFLEHERYELVTATSALPGAADRREIGVRLERKGCRPVVPFTLVKWRSGWLVLAVDLGQAGNPARPCPSET